MELCGSHTSETFSSYSTATTTLVPAISGRLPVSVFAIHEPPPALMPLMPVICHGR